jgi:exosome complex exonuclease DIS3/RRP44
VVSSTFTKSVIRSRAALTYAEAQSRIDDPRLTDELSVRGGRSRGGARARAGARALFVCGVCAGLAEG